jgi:hypothetical protein
LWHEILTLHGEHHLTYKFLVPPGLHPKTPSSPPPPKDRKKEERGKEKRERGYGNPPYFSVQLPAAKI